MYRHLIFRLGLILNNPAGAVPLLLAILFLAFLLGTVAANAQTTTKAVSLPDGRLALLPDPVSVITANHDPVIMSRVDALAKFKVLRNKPTLDNSELQLFSALVKALSTFTTYGNPPACSFIPGDGCSQLWREWNANPR